MKPHPIDRHNTSSSRFGRSSLAALGLVLALGGCDLQTYASKSQATTWGDGSVVRTTHITTVTTFSNGQVERKVSKTVVRRTGEGRDVTESSESVETLVPRSQLSAPAHPRPQRSPNPRSTLDDVSRPLDSTQLPSTHKTRRTPSITSRS
jgi:hypothetical protein